MSRIIILNRRYCPGEAWTNRTLAYAKGFAELGEEVIVYYLIADKQRNNYEISIPGVKFIDLWKQDNFLEKRFRLLSFVRNIYRFKKEVREGDFVFFYGGYDYQLRIAMDIRKKAKVFCEVTEHPSINGTSKSRLQLVNIKKALNLLDGLFVISNALKEYYISVGVKKSCISVINMFVDTTRFIGLQKNTTNKYIAYCGAVSYEKDGADVLIKSFAYFYSNHTDYKLYIIGKGINPNVISQLKDLSRSLGIEQAVVFTGAVTPSEMPSLLYNASILALARPNNIQAQNGFPTKLGEYLATGKPVVVTRVGEIPCFIKHKENGFLAEPTPESFSEQLAWIADNYEEALKVGKNGKLLADTEFSYLVQSKKALQYMNSISNKIINHNV